MEWDIEKLVGKKLCSHSELSLVGERHCTVLQHFCTFQNGGFYFLLANQSSQNSHTLLQNLHHIKNHKIAPTNNFITNQL